MLGKKLTEKTAKNVFLYSHEYRDQKMGEQNARNNFSRNTRIVREKMFGKNFSENSAKNVFLYSHEYRELKMVETKRAKQFFHQHTNRAGKKCWEKNRRKKVRKTFFYIHTNIVN